jgi:hypothetical protein
MYGSYHHITVLGKEDAACTETYDVVGSLCENNDKFAIDRMLPPTEIGDLLFIHAFMYQLSSAAGSLLCLLQFLFQLGQLPVGKLGHLFQIVFPLMKPALAAVGFMMATMYWNDWQNALLFIDSDRKKPLQLLLINIQKSIEALLSNRNIPPAVLAAMQGRVPQYSATMATVVVVIGPIMIAYPFFQKYFIKGLMIGSVKG